MSFDNPKKAVVGEVQKFPLRRLQPSIQKFLKVVEIDLDRLHKHRLNIEKYNRLEDWNSLDREQTNASRTVQQLIANIREMEKMRNQVLDEDLVSFDGKTLEIRQTAMTAMMEFIDFGQGKASRSNTEEDTGFSDSSETDFLMSTPSTSAPVTPQREYTLVSPSLPSDLGQLQVQHNTLPQDSAARESWENLHENLVELNSMIQEFATAVHSQQEQIDDIQDNIDNTQENVRQATGKLGQASKLKSVIFPIAGAVIGGCVGGPVGFVAGLKLGGLVGVVGGAVGFTGGKLIERRQRKVVDTELQNLSAKRSTSLPDLSEKKTNESWFPWKS